MIKIFGWDRNYARGYLRIGIGLAACVVLAAIGFLWAEASGANPNHYGFEFPRISSSFWELSPLPTGWVLWLNWLVLGIGLVMVVAIMVIAVIFILAVIHAFAGLVGGPAQDSAKKAESAGRRVVQEKGDNSTYHAVR